MSLNAGDLVFFDNKPWVVIEIWEPTDKFYEDEILVNYLTLQSLSRNEDGYYCYHETHEPNLQKTNLTVSIEDRYKEYRSEACTYG